MRILITGGAGFIGSNFVKYVLNDPVSGISHVTVLDKLTYAGNIDNLVAVAQRPDFSFIKGDICDERLVTQLVEEVDAVVNFAAESHVDRSISNSDSFVKTNIVGVQVILDALKMAKGEKRLLQVSTDEVYGSIPVGSWSENSPLLPNSPYSATKASGELLTRAYHRTFGLDVITTRCSNNYGPYHYPEKLIPLFITNLIEGKKIPVYGSGNNVRDWLHVDDHCRGIYAALTRGKPGQVYNIGGGEELTNLQITEFILDAMGLDANFVEFVEDRKGHDFRYSVNWCKIQTELGYEPQIKFQDGLRDTIRWFEENENWWKPLKIRSGL